VLDSCLPKGGKSWMLGGRRRQIRRLLGKEIGSLIRIICVETLFLNSIYFICSCPSLNSKK
jgi:hypothetical protein